MRVTGRITRTIGRMLLACLLAHSTVLVADERPAPNTTAPTDNPLSEHSRHLYRGVKLILLSAAERMPEEHYGFKPTDGVRSFGQIVGHVTDAQYLFCSAVRDEKNPGLKIDATKATKADLIAALRHAFAYCDDAYDGMTDARGSGTVKFTGKETPRLGVLYVNQIHAIEHYGNLLTYIRLKGLVPPTSDPEIMKELSK